MNHDVVTVSHPSAVAEHDPDRAAIVMAATGETVTFGALDARVNQLSHLMRARGVERGQGIAILMENHPRFLEVAWTAQSAGLYYTAINRHLTVEEITHIVRDCGATVLVSSAQLAPVADAVRREVEEQITTSLMVDGTVEGWESYEGATGAQPTTPIADACEGDFMLYSSGTTGRPKGIKRPLPYDPLGTGFGVTLGVAHVRQFGLDDGCVYLSPAPLYHSAPLGWCMIAQRVGATVVIMERFDPAAFLESIGRYHVTHTQVVPTMFVRMLKLPEAERTAYPLEGLQAVVHAAAPCPPDVKRQMIEWLGPIVFEYYSSTEGVGGTFIDSAEWLTHPGSVGRPMRGAAHVLDDDGNELGTGEVGTLWFEGATFEYHNDPEKTAAAKNDKGWGTVGDIGYIDEEGYVYLTDRKSFMIISGGVNIYPQEIENALVLHPKVADVAVFGVPSAEFGEDVKAVVQPARWSDAGPELAAELQEFCRNRLAGFKCPRSIDFERELPRLETGKLYKASLRDRYLA